MTPAPESPPDLTFAHLSEVNRSRCERWHKGFPFDDMWTMADWSNAMVGEVGELVDATGALLAVVSHSGQLANIIKKLRRLECGSDPGPDDPPAYRLLEMVADEMGDVVAYLDLLATFLGIDLGAAVANKFNRVSEHQGFSERLP